MKLFFYSLGIIVDGIDDDFQDTIEENKDTTILYYAFSAYILTSAAEIGYLEKEKALLFLTHIEKRVREICSSWEEYVNFFIEGEKKSRIK